MATASQSLIIAAPVAQCFAVITDFANYPKFLPEISATTVRTLDADENTLEVDITAQIVMALKYTIHVECEAPHHVAWRMIRGNVMKINAGSWTLTAKGKSTHAQYDIEVTLGALVPQAITKVLIETTLPSTLNHFKQRIESLTRKTKKSQ